MIERYQIERTNVHFVDYCSGFGKLVPQNENGALVVEIKDIEGERGYSKGKPLPFHTDCGSDYLVIRRLKGEGGNRLVDSRHIFRSLSKEHKAILQGFFPYTWGEFPIFVKKGLGSIFCRYLRGYVKEEECSPTQIEALDRFDYLANKLSFELSLTPGDTCVINNARMLHSRENSDSERISLRAWVKVLYSENPFWNRFDDLR